MNYFLFIPFGLIVLFMLPIKAKLHFSCNLLERSGAFSIFLFNFKLMHDRFWLKGKKILLQNEKETSTVEIGFDSKEVVFLEVFSQVLRRKTRLKSLYLFYNIGTSDAFSSAMLGGAINLAALIFFTSLKNTRPTASMGVYDTVSYNRDVLEFALKSGATISLFDGVYSFVISLMITNRIVKRKLEDKLRKGEV